MVTKSTLPVELFSTNYQLTNYQPKEYHITFFSCVTAAGLWCHVLNVKMMWKISSPFLRNLEIDECNFDTLHPCTNVLNWLICYIQYTHGFALCCYFLYRIYKFRATCLPLLCVSLTLRPHRTRTWNQNQCDWRFDYNLDVSNYGLLLITVKRYTGRFQVSSVIS